MSARAPSFVLALALAGPSAACSLVLDPDELTAAHLDGELDVVGETTAPDTTAPDTADTADTGLAETLDTRDTTPDEADAPDTPDMTDTPDMIDTQDTAPAEVRREVIVHHSGGVACTFDYSLALTQCPQTCGAWTYVVDASRSVGVGSFAWSFEATGGFRVSPPSAAGARVTLTLDVPECLVGGTDMRPFSILARLSTDGGPAALVDLPTIGVGQVTFCEGSGSCPAP